ncbi:MAG: glycosyltransferase family 2 protein [Microgenomates group bacterium]
MKRVSIIIPVYNEENYIVKTLQAVSMASTLKFEKEIIIVDDGSYDKTISKIQEYIKKIKTKKGVSFQLIKKKANEGKGAALKDGFIKSTGDIVIVQDADLEYIPTDYPTLLQPFVEFNADVVYGSRFVSGKPHRIVYYWHHVANKFLTILSNMLTNLNFTDMETGYKVFRGPLIRSIAPKLESKRFGFEPEITARIAQEHSATGSLKIYEVGISYMGRTYAEGKKINWVDGIRAIAEIITFNLFR